MRASSSTSDVKYWCPLWSSKGSIIRLIVSQSSEVPIHVKPPSSSRKRCFRDEDLTTLSFRSQRAAPIEIPGSLRRRTKLPSALLARLSKILRRYATPSEDRSSSKIVGPYAPSPYSPSTRIVCSVTASPDIYAATGCSKRSKDCSPSGGHAIYRPHGSATPRLEDPTSAALEYYVTPLAIAMWQDQTRVASARSEPPLGAGSALLQRPRLRLLGQGYPRGLRR